MATEEIFIGRQPILDRSRQLVAFELLFRSGAQKNEALIQSDLGATANVINHAFGELGIEQALGPYKGFINCDESLLLSDMLEVLPTDKIVLEILEHVAITPTLVERCKELKARGFTLALDDFVGDEDKCQPLLDLIEIVKVDLMPLSVTQLGDVTAALKQRWPGTLLAEKVDSREQADLCHRLGYSLFQGYYFAKPVILSGRKLNHSQLSLMRLLGLVLEDADTASLEDVLKQEPGLAMNLLRLTNSVANGLRTHITSLRHAITALGRRQLQRWLQLLLYTNPAGGDVASPLLQLAATRGRLLELLAGKLQSGAHEFEDHAFLTGIMSLMPTLMGMALEELFKSIQLAAEVQQALESRTGTLGIMLQLTEALEDGNGQACHDLTGQLPGIDHQIVNACLAQALAWASSIGKEKA